jgi:hypothetical protein
MQLYADHIYENLFESKLPLDLAKMILSFIQLLQPTLLKEDIASFYKRKAQFTEIYYKRWTTDEDVNDWLSNDIVSYSNDFQGTMFGLVPKMLKKWRRLFLFQDKDEQYIIDAVNHFLYKKNVSTGRQINTFLGIFTPEERDDLIYIVSGTFFFGS